MILEVVPTLVLREWDAEPSPSIWVAGSDGDSGTLVSTGGWVSSMLEIGSTLWDLKELLSATSLTSFIPARTLTRPEIASTFEASWTWLTCKALNASRTSFMMAVWFGEDEDAIVVALHGNDVLRQRSHQRGVRYEYANKETVWLEGKGRRVASPIIKYQWLSDEATMGWNSNQDTIPENRYIS
jgi:hypothetical protein